MAFVSSSNNNSGNNNEAVNTANGVSTTSTQVNDAFSLHIDNLSDAIICAFLASQPNSPQLAHEELKQIHPDDMEEIDLRWQMAIALRNQDFKNKESSRRSVPMETPTSSALLSCDGLCGYDWSDQAEKGPNYAFMAYSSSSSDSKPKIVRKNDDALIIEEWVSDNEEDDVSQPNIEMKIVKPSIVKKEFVRSKQQDKTTRKTVKQVEQPRQNTHRPRGNQRNWNNMMS
ncbi:hypothetical protein Tco_0645786 [Tanacetum coccineum]